MSTLIIIFVQLIIYNSNFRNAISQNPESIHRQKGNQADLNAEVLSKIAQGEKADRDDTLKILGTLDEDEGNDEEYDVEHGQMDTAAMADSYLVQKFQNATEDAPNKLPSTTYHSFDDSSYRSPIFTRSGDDYKSDFIIFTNPSFPQGTGHYVVLRRLDAPNHPFNYDIDDDLSTEFENDYNQENDYDDENAGRKKLISDGMDEGPDAKTPAPAGQVQSGEENYADTDRAGPKEDGVGNDDMDYGDDTLAAKSKYRLQISHSSSSSSSFSTQDDDPPPGQAEVLYEAFSINFKGSVQGYISDMDPLQYSFLNQEEDPVMALMEDDNNLLTEGDEDSDTDEEEEELNMGAQGKTIMNIDTDKDFMDFQKNIKSDAGMMKTGGEDEDGKNDDNTGDDDTRKKRSIIPFHRKRVIITPSIRTKKSNSFEWKGCLRVLNVNQLWRKPKSSKYFQRKSF